MRFVAANHPRLISEPFVEAISDQLEIEALGE